MISSWISSGGAAISLRPKPTKSRYPGCTPTATPWSLASATVLRIVVGSPAWKPPATLAEEMYCIISSSKPIFQGPKLSPMSQLMSTCTTVHLPFRPSSMLAGSPPFAPDVRRVASCPRRLLPLNELEFAAPVSVTDAVRVRGHGPLDTQELIHALFGDAVAGEADDCAQLRLPGVGGDMVVVHPLAHLPFSVLGSL